MKHSVILFLLLLTIHFSFAQIPLGKARIDRLKSSVVRIHVNGQSSGTGFFVLDDGNGWVATCWHVIQPAIVLDSLGVFRGEVRKIDIELTSKERIEAEIPASLVNTQSAFTEVESKDYCLLKLKTKPKTPFVTLKLGRWKDINEGDLIYSSGYPLAIEHQVPTQGMFSVKTVDTLNGLNGQKILRQSALLDLTMNKGNSGGPVLKFGKTATEDLVIGIATFIIVPYAQLLQRASYESQIYGSRYDIRFRFDEKDKGFSQMQTFNTLANALAANSIGVSGAVSIDYLVRFIGPSKR
ncbi:hypothetical protein GCM10027592_28970 [Spirosoma flavus]